MAGCTDMCYCWGCSQAALLMPLIQLGKSQPHDGAAAAVALQRVFVSVLAGHYRSCSSTGCPDSSTWCSQQWWRHGHPPTGPHQKGVLLYVPVDRLMEKFSDFSKFNSSLDSRRKKIWLDCSEWLRMYEEYCPQEGMPQQSHLLIFLLYIFLQNDQKHNTFLYL